MKSRDSAALARQGFGILIFCLFFLGVFLTSSPYKAGSEYSQAQLRQAFDYVQALGPDTQIFLYRNGQPETKIHADSAFAKDVADSLIRERRGRYRRAWGTEHISIVAVDTFFTADQEARLSQLRDLPMQDFIKEDMLALPRSNLGCHAASFQKFNWAVGGYVLVDLGYHREHSRSAIDCVLAGFDALDGLPLKSNSFDQARLPDIDVRLVIVDYVRLCAHQGMSDAPAKVRSRYGISSLPSLGCVARELSMALSQRLAPSSR
ncbi:hypothetical protein ACSV9I_10005 [Rhizobium sp. G187]|uniref:hypothetical protein n=1 Tax=Rhizobium sp. G187 TaxID=3451352 RepID=UPI003EE79784